MKLFGIGLVCAEERVRSVFARAGVDDVRGRRVSRTAADLASAKRWGHGPR